MGAGASHQLCPVASGAAAAAVPTASGIGAPAPVGAALMRVALRRLVVLVVSRIDHSSRELSEVPVAIEQKARPHSAVAAPFENNVGNCRGAAVAGWQRVEIGGERLRRAIVDPPNPGAHECVYFKTTVPIVA